MWRSVAFSLLLLASAAVAQEPAKPFSLFGRSQHYSMNVDVVPLALDAYNYNVTVTDLAANEVVLQTQLSADSAQKPAHFERTSGDLRLLVALRQREHTLTASFEAVNDDMVVDSLMIGAAIAPHRRVVGGVIGGVIPLPQRPLPPNTYRVGGDVHAPVVISRVEPSYTAEARKARVSGIVIVEALVDKNGVVRDVQVLKPLPFGLDQSAVDAVKQWRFEPGTKNGEPVDVVFNLTVNYTLATPPPPAR